MSAVRPLPHLPTDVAYEDYFDRESETWWAIREQLYAESARKDEALYAWLESIGKMPEPGREVPHELLKQWQAIYSEQSTHTNQANMTTNTNNNDKPTKRGARLHKGGGYVGSSQMGADRSFGRALMAAAKKLAKQRQQQQQGQQQAQKPEAL